MTGMRGILCYDSYSVNRAFGRRKFRTILLLYVIEYPGRFPARVEKRTMCRWIAYRGEPVALERYVTSPVHSLIEQSRRALESTDSTNGDGFGLGWYGEREQPGLYKDVRPARAGENLRPLCQHT